MPTILSAGDIAFTGFNSDNPDALSFVLLVDVEAGTQITFTDNGVFAAGGFRSNEGSFTWTADAALTAGVVVEPAVSGVAFSASGDQILAYQGDETAPTFIAAVDFNSTDYTDATSSNTTGLPSGLTVGLNALNLGETDNGVYTGTTTGSKADLLAAINNPDNWSLSASRIADIAPSDFVLQDGGDAGAGDGSGDGSSDGSGDTDGSGDGEEGAITKISEVQGAGDASTIDGDVVTVEAIVVGDFQDGDADDARNLRGFFLQEEDADADGDANTSEGVFVFDSTFGVDVQVGDKVRVTGTVDEYFGETQIDAITAVEVISSGNELPTAAAINLPAEGTSLSQDGDVQPDLEAYEGMRVVFPQQLVITEQFQLDRFNEVKLVAGDRPQQFTQTNAPDANGYQAHLEEVGARTITYDDGENTQNASIGQLDGFGPTYTAENAPRMGDTTTGLTGVLDYKWAGNSASGATWRVRATEDGSNTFTRTSDGDSPNPRPEEAPEVGGELKVVSFNVLNFFTTLDTSGATTALGHDPRGADNQDEFDRQLEKLVNAIVELDADVLGLVELENDFSEDGAIAALVEAVNARLGAEVYEWVNPGAEFVGTDAISTGVIYKSDSVNLVGSEFLVFGETSADTTFAAASALNDFVSSDDEVQDFDRNRPAVAATFTDNDGEEFTVVVNHFKSKGDSNLEDTFLDATNSGAPQEDIDALLADPNYDQGDGAGFWNQVRLDAVVELVDWLENDYSVSDDEDILILGDLNAYAKEDPVQYLINQGFTDLGAFYEGESAYSFVFDGQTGTLDYALASSSFMSQITGAADWHINADEADATDYNFDFGRDQSIFDGDSAARNSDHDPIIVGLDLGSDEPSGATPVVGDDEDENFGPTDGDDKVFAQGGNDTLSGGEGNDVLKGQDGDDRISGGAERDLLAGGDGDDSILGGEGDDRIIGGADDDVMRGQEGADVFVYNEADFGRDRVLGFESGVDSFEISTSLAANFDDVEISVNQTGVAQIEFGGGAIILGRIGEGLPTEDDFIFV